MLRSKLSHPALPSLFLVHMRPRTHDGMKSLVIQTKVPFSLGLATLNGLFGVLSM